MFCADDDLGAGPGEGWPRAVPDPECERHLVRTWRNHERLQHAAGGAADRGAPGFGREDGNPDIGATAERGEHLADVPADPAGGIHGVGEDADSYWCARLDECSPIAEWSVQYGALAQGVRTLAVAAARN